MIPSEATCSLLQMNRFFSEIDGTGEGGKVLKHIYRNSPPFIAYNLWKDWVMKRAISDIEKALYRRKVHDSYDAVRLCDLMTADEWKRSKMHYIALVAGIHDLAYLWIRCSKDDLWAFCLRRYKHEEQFSLRDVAVLNEFGDLFYRMRNVWYLEKLRVLSKKERQIVALLYKRQAPDEIAETLGISVQTYRTHMKNIHRKLDAHDSLEVILKLEND